MSAYKKLNQQDAFITTYTARKSWTASGSQYADLGIQNIVGLSGSGAYYTQAQDIVYGGGVNSTAIHPFNRRLVFESNHHLYYSGFDDPSGIQSGSYENYLQSSFNVSGSRNLNTRVAIISLPKEMYGTHIEPNSVSILPDLLAGTGSNYVDNNYVTDPDTDANGTSFDNADNLYMENTFHLYGSDFPLNDLDYIENESNYVVETDPNPGEYLDIDVPDEYANEIIDDGEGNLYLKYSNPRRYVGNVIYTHGQLIITDDIVAMYYNYYFNGLISWKSNLPIYTHNYHCKIKSAEFNHTLNKSAYDITTGEKNANVSGSYFTPYITTLGLYNDANELIAVAKMGQPLPKSDDTDMAIVVKLDMNFGVDRLLGGRITPICTYYFTFRNFVQVTGFGLNRDGSQNTGQERRITDDGTYQLYLKKDNGDYIQRDVDGVENVYHLVKEVRGNNSHYRSNCYVDVIVTGNKATGFEYQVLYGTGTNSSNKRKERFFINILEQYLYENNLSCSYTYETPIAGTLPYSLRQELAV